MSQKTENTFVDRIIDVVIHRRRMVEKVFAVLVLLSIVANFFIPINYDLTEYLPDWAPTMQGINRMEESFGYPGTARVMIDDVTMAQAGAYQRQLSEIEGVDSVSWLPGGNAYLPESFLTVGDISDYYKDNSAIMDVIFTYGDSDPRTYEAIDSMKELLGEKGHYSGPAIENKTLEESISREMPMIMAAGVVVIFAVLAITTTSWFEPVLFLLTMALPLSSIWAPISSSERSPSSPMVSRRSFSWQWRWTILSSCCTASPPRNRRGSPMRRPWRQHFIRRWIPSCPAASPPSWALWRWL